MPRKKKSSPAKKKAIKKKNSAKKKSQYETTSNFSENTLYIPINDIVLNDDFQLRVDRTNIKPLAQDIKEKAQLVPLFVRPSNKQKKKYELICGHRRLDALRAAKKIEALVLIRNVDDSEAFRIAIADNIQRENFTALDTAFICLDLSEKGMKRGEIADLVFPNLKAKDRDRTVANYLLVARSHTSIHEALSKGHINFSHARILAACLNEEEEKGDVGNSFLVSESLDFIIEIVRKRDLSVRECKDLIKQRKADACSPSTGMMRRAKSEPCIFQEGKNGNWSLRVSFHRVKCENDPSIIDTLQNELKNASDRLDPTLTADTHTNVEIT